MDYSNLLNDAFQYSKEGVFGSANQWVKLILAIICIGIPINGYVMRIYRGAVPAPEVDQWGNLFIEGLKLVIVGIIYTIPMMVIWAFLYGSTLLAVIEGNMQEAQNVSPNLGLMLALYAVELVVYILMPVAAIRFARMGSFSEAFNFTAILETIKKIGWINYTIALILVTIVIAIPISIILFGLSIIREISIIMLGGSSAALIGFSAVSILIILVIAPLFCVFQARYMTRLYDSAERET